MTVSFLFPDPKFLDFFRNGQTFIGYTADREEVSFIVVNESTFVCDINGILCAFDPMSWTFISETSDIFQLDEMIPCPSNKG